MGLRVVALTNAINIFLDLFDDFDDVYLDNISII